MSSARVLQVVNIPGYLYLKNADGSGDSLTVDS